MKNLDVALIIPIWLFVSSNTVLAADVETIKTIQHPTDTETRTTTTTVTPDNAVIMRDMAGRDILMGAPSSTTVETQTIKNRPNSEQTTIKNKKDSHHLLHMHIPFFGVNVF